MTSRSSSMTLTLRLFLTLARRVLARASKSGKQLRPQKKMINQINRPPKQETSLPTDSTVNVFVGSGRRQIP